MTYELMTAKLMTDDLPLIEQAVLELLPESIKVLKHSLTLKMLDDSGKFELNMLLRVEEVFTKGSGSYNLVVSRKFHNLIDKHYIADILANMLILKYMITEASIEAYKGREEADKYLRDSLAGENNKTNKRLDGIVSKLSNIPFIGGMFDTYQGAK